MIRFAIFFILINFSSTTFAQNRLRNVDELINTTDPGWPFVQQLLDSATNKVEVLPCDTSKIEKAIFETQVTTRSPLGAVIYSTGGILIDNGWIRILGSGSDRLSRTVPAWNKGKSFKKPGEKPTFLLVADDAVGGFFAINGGLLGKDEGKIYYLSPDRLLWEPLDLTYTDFLSFCFSGDLEDFYKNLRWIDWRKDVSKLNGNKVYSFKPFLWTKEGKNINNNERKLLPVEDQFNFNMKTRKRLGLDKRPNE